MGRQSIRLVADVAVQQHVADGRALQTGFAGLPPSPLNAVSLDRQGDESSCLNENRPPSGWTQLVRECLPSHLETCSLVLVALRAIVKDGRLVLDEPTDLPDGTVLELVVDDESGELEPEELGRLNVELKRSAAALGAGQLRRWRRTYRPPPSQVLVTRRVLVAPNTAAEIERIDAWWRRNRLAAPNLFTQEVSAAFRTSPIDKPGRS